MLLVVGQQGKLVRQRDRRNRHIGYLKRVTFAPPIAGKQASLFRDGRSHGKTVKGTEKLACLLFFSSAQACKNLGDVDRATSEQMTFLNKVIEIFTAILSTGEMIDDHGSIEKQGRQSTPLVADDSFKPFVGFGTKLFNVSCRTVGELRMIFHLPCAPGRPERFALPGSVNIPPQNFSGVGRAFFCSCKPVDFPGELVWNFDGRHSFSGFLYKILFGFLNLIQVRHPVKRPVWIATRGAWIGLVWSYGSQNEMRGLGASKASARSFLSDNAKRLSLVCTYFISLSAPFLQTLSPNTLEAGE